MPPRAIECHVHAPRGLWDALSNGARERPQCASSTPSRGKCKSCAREVRKILSLGSRFPTAARASFATLRIARPVHFEWIPRHRWSVSLRMEKSVPRSNVDSRTAGKPKPGARCVPPRADTACPLSRVAPELRHHVPSFRDLAREESGRAYSRDEIAFRRQPCSCHLGPSSPVRFQRRAGRSVAGVAPARSHRPLGHLRSDARSPRAVRRHDRNSPHSK